MGARHNVQGFPPTDPGGMQIEDVFADGSGPVKQHLRRHGFNSRGCATPMWPILRELMVQSGDAGGEGQRVSGLELATQWLVTIVDLPEPAGDYAVLRAGASIRTEATALFGTARSPRAT